MHALLDRASSFDCKLLSLLALFSLAVASCGDDAGSSTRGHDGGVSCTPKPRTEACGADVCGEVDDGCGTNIICGTCNDPTKPHCNEGVCSKAECQPKTKDQVCKDHNRVCGKFRNGCGKNIECGKCGDDDICNAKGQCLTPSPHNPPPMSCQPNCQGKMCGDDGCGGSCGGCNLDQNCENNQCILKCQPACTGKCNGASDGCGGTCNAQCADDEVCYNKHCQKGTDTCPAPKVACAGRCGEHFEYSLGSGCFYDCAPVCFSTNSCPYPGYLCP